MTQLKELRKQAKEKGLRGYHTCTDIMTDGDINICVDCGVVCGMEVDYGGDFSSMKILSTKKMY